jgi:hypothetical protein
MRIRRQYLITLPALCALLLGTLLATAAHGIEQHYPGPFVENEDLLMVLIPHTPEQMTAFYEARGFPKAALEQLGKVCFVTVHIENKSRRVIWMETANWELSSEGRTRSRLGDAEWTRWWNEINLPDANRSTFNWTQLPAVRDLQPGESVGGNIILEGDVKHFDLHARFLTGQDKRDGMLDIKFRDIECPKEGPRP